jgi:hypothetical protein
MGNFGFIKNLEI